MTTPANAVQKVLAEPAEGAETLFSISDLAQEFGVSTRTIRFYEDKGLIAPARVGGARVYSRRDRARLALILRAKAIGAPLSDIREFLDLYGEKGEGRRDQIAFLLRRLGEEIASLETKRALIDDTLKDLRAMRRDAERAAAALP